MTTHVALLGAAGMLGKDLVACVPPEFKLLAFTHNDIDITDLSDVERLFIQHSPQVVINAAAYTAVDNAEKEPAVANQVNGVAPRLLATAAARFNCRLVHFSTDYVFDGTASTPYTEVDVPNPVNVYGLSKLLGEQAVVQSPAEALVLRTQWLFGVNGRSFPRTIMNRLKSRQPVRVVDDQIGRPTSTRELAGVVWECVRNGVTGLLHVANEGVTSWYHVARELATMVGVPELVSPCSSKDFVTLARRPLYTPLSTTKLQLQTGVQLPHWISALRDFAQQLSEERIPDHQSTRTSR